MNLLPFFEWCEATAVGTAIRESIWLFPVVEASHLLGLAMIGGAVLIVDLRLFGWGVRSQPVAKIARDVHPWMVGSTVVMVVTGVLLFLSEATKCYFNAAFWVKMAFLLLALIYTFTIRRDTLMADETPGGLTRSRMVAVISVLLWSGVGLAGRAIGFY